MVLRAATFALLWLCVVADAAAERTDPAPSPGSPAPDALIASDVRLAGDESQTRMVIDFNQKLEMRAFTLADPYRVVIDMPQVAFRFRPRTGEAGRGLIKAFR